jgi:hypothetical protein
MLRKKFLTVLLTVLAFWGMYAQNAIAESCTNGAVVSGKYVVDGYGTVYSGPLCGFLGLPICAATTVTTTGYIVFGDNGNITSADLEEATDTGVQTLIETGKYTISGCQLTVWLNGAGTFSFVGNLQNLDSRGVAHGGGMVATDPGTNEVLRFARTVDPAPSYSLANVTVDGKLNGFSPDGRPWSGISHIKFNADGTSFEETDLIVTGDGPPQIKKYAATCKIDSNWMMRCVETDESTGEQLQAVHQIMGDDPYAPSLHDWIRQGESDTQVEFG